MPDITVFTPNGHEIGNHPDSDFEATDIGIDTPEASFTSITTKKGTVEYWGEVIVKVVKSKKEGE